MLLLDLPLQNTEVWEQETNPSPTSHGKEVNLKKSKEKTTPHYWKQNRECRLEQWCSTARGVHRLPFTKAGCKLPLVSKDQRSPFPLSPWRDISGRASNPCFPHRVIDYSLPLQELIGFLVPGKWLMNISGHGPLFLLGVLFTCLQWAWGFFSRLGSVIFMDIILW